MIGKVANGINVSKTGLLRLLKGMGSDKKKAQLANNLRQYRMLGIRLAPEIVDILSVYLAGKTNGFIAGEMKIVEYFCSNLDQQQIAHLVKNLGSEKTKVLYEAPYIEWQKDLDVFGEYKILLTRDRSSRPVISLKHINKGYYFNEGHST